MLKLTAALSCSVDLTMDAPGPLELAFTDNARLTLKSDAPGALKLLPNDAELEISLVPLLKGDPAQLLIAEW